jgi:hypothetical protein
LVTAEAGDASNKSATHKTAPKSVRLVVVLVLVFDSSADNAGLGGTPISGIWFKMTTDETTHDRLTAAAGQA